MQNSIEVQTLLDEARAKATIQIVVNGEPLAHAIFDAPEFDELISGLAAVRAKMADEVPRSLDPGSRMAALVDPAWQHPRETLPESKVLALRHPGLGWLTFQFPAHEAEAIARYLSSGSHQPLE